MSPCAVQANTLVAENPQRPVIDCFDGLGRMSDQAVPLKRMMVPLSPPAKISVSDEPQMLLRVIGVPVSICVQIYTLRAQACRAEIKKQTARMLQAAPMMLRFMRFTGLLTFHLFVRMTAL